MGEGNSYEWMLDSVLFSNEKNPVLDLPDMESSSSWLVCLAMENEFGCRDTVCKTLSISSELILFMPSAFTPDNDGVNDLFFPTIIGAERAEYSFAIFNRWGDLIWETRELEGKWNGQGAIEEGYFARDEVYTWKITVKKAESPVKKSYQGKVTILR
jgi:gliding motility-associated-like protein